MSYTIGQLYLIPTPIGNTPIEACLPAIIKETINHIDYFIVENEKTARRFIKNINPEKKQSELIFFELNKFTDISEIPSFLLPLHKGKNIGLLSEAGCPAIADPGAIIVELAHQQHIKVVPMVGPSSILLTMMGSGFNGQNFAFVGYLPIDKNERKRKLKYLEQHSTTHNQAQLFIETPYRNNKLLEDIIQVLHPETKLCIGCNVNTENAYIKTRPIKDWKNESIDLHKKPTIFAIQK